MHVTAKPSSFQCNLKCDYCFYLEKESQFTHEKWMDDSTLKEFIKQYIAASGNQVYFTWQGGEPTLAGLDFFRKVIHYQQRYAGQKRIFNALQTNGILLNNEWCAFLKEHEFLVGISIDGPQELHDCYRRSNSGNGTFAKVIAAIERLKSYQIEFNTLTVINNINVHYPLEVYHFLKSIGSKHMQFIESELKTMNSVQLTAQKKRISAKCQQCVYKPICNGGCPKHRITKVNNETVSYFCEGYKILFSTMVPYMNAMVELAKNRVPLYHIMDVAKQMENN
ncbi:radical SAM protein [Escherichia coli]|nr:radical SAM protein [Escherichia coli]